MAKRKPKADELVLFRAWLTEHGAEVLEPTNEYELVRFRSDKGTSILYRNAAGSRTPTGQMHEALTAFRAGQVIRFAAKSARKVQGDPVRRAIVARDGDACFYHGGSIADDDVTVEHLVSATHGGPNHIANKFLSCRPCNSRAGHLSAPEKIRLREQLHGFVRQPAPPAHAILCEAA